MELKVWQHNDIRQTGDVFYKLGAYDLRTENNRYKPETKKTDTPKLVGNYVSEEVWALITRSEGMYHKGPFGSFYIELITRILKTPYFKQSWNETYELNTTHHGYDFKWNNAVRKYQVYVVKKFENDPTNSARLFLIEMNEINFNKPESFETTHKEMLVLPDYNCGSLVKISKFLLIISCINTGSVIIYKDFDRGFHESNLVLDFKGYNQT